MITSILLVCILFFTALVVHDISAMLMQKFHAPINTDKPKKA